MYSLRARPRPTVSTPVTWDEVEAAADGGDLSFEAGDVLARVEEHGDLFAATLTTRAGAPGVARLSGREVRAPGGRAARLIGPCQPTSNGGHNNMNRRDLVKAISTQTEVDAKTVDAVIKGFTDVVTAVVAKGEPVAITGFAKFAKVERAARMGRNPATGEAIKIKASKKARITPLKGFKDAVMTPSQAPKLNKGVFPPA